jgi:glycosyltransferase involved in cell wall biosynthesis
MIDRKSGLRGKFIMKIVFVAYNYQPTYSSPADWIGLIRPLHEVMSSLAKQSTVIYAGQINFTGEYFQDGVQYLFLKKASNKRFPFYVHKVIKELKPDAIVVLGLHFPLQVLQLRAAIGKKTAIILRHHADKPAKGLKKLLLRLADRSVDAYLFTSLGNATEWQESGIINDPGRIHEVLAGSTRFSRQDKNESKQQACMTGDGNFLWVGTLDANKDPLTVLSAFEKYAMINPQAKLYMVYHEAKLLEEVKQKINNGGLHDRVMLIGKTDHAALETWYSAADYFVSGSHREGGSYALTEAMACGCVPVVTNIPAAMKVIDHGKAGYYYEPGDVNGLFTILCELDKNKQAELSVKVENHFRQHFSTDAIAEKIRKIVMQIKGSRGGAAARR